MRKKERNYITKQLNKLIDYEVDYSKKATLKEIRAIVEYDDIINKTRGKK